MSQVTIDKTMFVYLITMSNAGEDPHYTLLDWRTSDDETYTFLGEVVVTVLIPPHGDPTQISIDALKNAASKTRAQASVKAMEYEEQAQNLLALPSL